MRFPFLRVVTGIVFLVLAIAGASQRASFFAMAGEDKPAGVTVSIDNFSFSPKEITVAKGTTVTWVNRDDVPHTVVSGGFFRSKALDTGDKFTQQFTTAGTVEYYCAIHPMMTGKIVVTP